MAARSRSYRDLFASGRLQGLSRLVDGSICSDDGKEFKVHKFILSKGSEYFRVHFRYDFGKETVISGLGSKILENILIFLYTGEAFLDEDNIADMMIAADYLLIDSLLMHCRTFAKQNISLRCCIPLLAAAWIVERLGIVKDCYRYVQIHFGSLVHINNSNIPELPLNTLKKLLNDDSLGVDNEEIIWLAIKTWVEEHTSDRLQHVPELLSCLRLNLSNSSLLSDINNHLLVKENPFCNNLDEDKSVQSLISTFTESLKIVLHSERCPRKMYLFLCNMPFPNSNGTLDVFLTYDGELDIWRKVGETHTNFHTLILMNQIIYMFNTFSNEIQAFDLKLKTWYNPSHPRTSRQGYSVIHNKDRMYVIGGSVFMSLIQLSEVEYYEPSIDMWLYTSPLPSITISGSAAVDNKLYVVGFLQVFERFEMKSMVYDPFLKSWSDIEKPKLFRTHFATVSFRQRVYILGGRTEENDVMTSAETYDPVQDKWEILPDLMFSYIMPQAVVLKDKLMVYDDHTGGKAIPRFSPSMWNEETLSWEMVDKFSPFNEIHRYHFCVIDDPMILSELVKENRDPATEWKQSPFRTGTL